jgi:4-carboxymuconolactone decarboxylase
MAPATITRLLSDRVIHVSGDGTCDDHAQTIRGRQEMAESSRREQGRAMRRKLMGGAYADKVDKSVYNDPIMEKFAEVTQETIFGTLWTRPGLDLKTRALICVISDAAQGRDPELTLHLRFARNQGWTEDELSEALLHLTGYVGAPLVREALLTARDTFAEMRAEG